MKNNVIKIGLIFFLAYTFLSLVTLVFFSAWAPDSWFKATMWYVMRRPTFLKYISGDDSYMMWYMPFNILFWTAVVSMATLFIGLITNRFKK